MESARSRRPLLRALTTDDLHKRRRRLALALADGTVRRTVDDPKATPNAAIRRQGAPLPVTISTPDNRTQVRVIRPPLSRVAQAA